MHGMWVLAGVTRRFVRGSPRQWSHASIDDEQQAKLKAINDGLERRMREFWLEEPMR